MQHFPQISLHRSGNSYLGYASKTIGNPFAQEVLDVLKVSYHGQPPVYLAYQLLDRSFQAVGNAYSREEALAMMGTLPYNTILVHFDNYFL